MALLSFFLSSSAGMKQDVAVYTGAAQTSHSILGPKAVNWIPSPPPQQFPCSPGEYCHAFLHVYEMKVPVPRPSPTKRILL